MRRLVTFAALAVAPLFVIAGSALGAGSKAALIFDSATNNGPPGNQPSLGAEAYGFAQVGDQITFAGTQRKVSNVVVKLSSWACVTGHWNTGDCVTPANTTYPLPLTLNIYATDGTLLASSAQTFNVSYRPSASPKCTDTNVGKWYSSAEKTCFNGLAQNVTFNFAGTTVLPNTVVYGVTYDTTHYGSNPIGEQAACVTGPGGCFYDSLNVALGTTSVGNDDTGTLFLDKTGVVTK